MYNKMAILAIGIIIGVVVGWWFRGGYNNVDIMNYYYAGEVNGYNRAYWGQTSNITSELLDATENSSFYHFIYNCD